MPTQYPVLDNRPIDQWKVTELKEELRRRKLPLKGLKDELVKRLGEAIRMETEAVNEVEFNNGFNPDIDSQGDCNEDEAVPLPDGKSEMVKDKNDEKTDNDSTVAYRDDGSEDVSWTTNVQDRDAMEVRSSDGTVEDTTANVVSVEDNIAAGQSLVPQLDLSCEDPSINEKNEDLKAPIEDAMLNPFESNNQVSEVSPDLGFQVKCESISTDSVSINEKNELKDNLNADNFHLELDVVKQEMVQPSSSDVPPISGNQHPLDDDKELGENEVSLEEVDLTCATDLDLGEKNDHGDGGSPEKLNLDRSSGAELIEDDVLESKHMQSNNNEVEEKNEICKVATVEEKTVVDVVVAGLSPGKKDTVTEEKMKPAAPMEKRKFGDNQAVQINEAPKRQRRWNSENIKLADVFSANISPKSNISTPKGAIQPAPRCMFTRSDSGLSGDSPKERIVPPSQKTATTSLKIDRFLRPFTLKAVQELLAKTGTVCNFWMDHIKTHCYVTYSSIEEAIATRNALYNLQWPPNGGRLLVADFVDPQEVKLQVEAPPQSPAPVTPSPTTPTAPSFQHQQAPQPSPRLQQQPPPPPSLPPPPLHNPPVKERFPPPPPTPKKPEPPVLTLDDLFKKTKTSPRIYYLPLCEELVAAKIAAQGKSVKEN